MSRLTRIRTGRAAGFARNWFYRIVLAWPRRHTCNLCGWSGRHFLSYWHRFVLCVRCGSHIRHRLVRAATDHRPDLTNGARLRDAVVLHISPEFCLRRWVEPVARLYVAADFAGPAPDVRVRAEALPFPDATFDTLVCLDTLEHVDDDRLAMREMRRVLKPGGVAILSVPQGNDLTRTIEDPSVTTPAARHAHYGQEDHVRLYGDDFVDRIAAAGLHPSVVRSADLPPALVRRHVLTPPVPIGGRLGFDERRVYFARRL